MTTITISLPNELAEKIDKASEVKGFATRSEFFRDLLRRYFTKEIPFNLFDKKPIDEIESDLLETGKYSRKFIKSVISGLKKSSVYDS